MTRIPENSVGEMGLSPKDRLRQVRRIALRVHDELQEYIKRYEQSHSYADVKGNSEFKLLVRLKSRLYSIVSEGVDDDDEDDDEDDDAGDDEDEDVKRV